MGISEFIRLCAVNMCRLLIKINNLINNLIKDPAVHRSTKKADKCLPDNTVTQLVLVRDPHCSTKAPPNLPISCDFV